MSSQVEELRDVQLDKTLQHRLAALVRLHHVPGASIAVLRDGVLSEAATGVLSRSTGVRATRDSVFQIGSITKVITATLVMQLVEEGSLDLDEPVASYVPEFATADPQVSRSITARHLLTHTAGFEGDVFVDTGRGDDALARFIPFLSEATQFASPGTLFSYSNAGYNVLGRLIEVLRRCTYERAVHTRVVQPLGLAHTACGADEAILFRAAAGHLPPAPGRAPMPVQSWSLMRSGAAAGTQVCMSAADLVRFSAVHMTTPPPIARAVLEPRTAAQMRTCHVDTTELLQPMSGRGLGWGLLHSEPTPVIGHMGATVGQYAFLRVVPDANLAIALLTNGGDAGAVSEALLGELLRDLAGVTVPTGLVTTRDQVEPTELARYAGRYEASLFSLELTASEDGHLWAERIPGSMALFVGSQRERYQLGQVSGGAFARVVKAGVGADTHVFLGEPGQPPRFLHTNGRALRRIPA